MSLTNEQARQRVQVLHTDIHTRQESVGSVQRKFEAINKETRQLIDTALKNEGVATIAELMQKVVNDIQDSDQKKAVQSALAQLNPPTTFTGIIWDKIKDPVTDELVIGQFIAINKLRTAVAAYNTASWDLSLAQVHTMGAINNAYRTRIATQFIAEAAADGASVGLDAAQVRAVENEAQMAVETLEASVAESSGLVTAGVDTAFETLALAQEATAAAATGCFVAVGVVLLFAGAQHLWNKYKSSDNADTLKEAIVELCSTRLYVAQSEQISQVFVTLSETAHDIVTAITATPPQPVDTLLAFYVKTAKSLQGNTSSDDRLPALYEILQAQDNGVNTAEDPDLATIVARHQKHIKDAKAETTAIDIMMDRRFVNFK